MVGSQEDPVREDFAQPRGVLPAVSSKESMSKERRGCHPEATIGLTSRGGNRPGAAGMPGGHARATPIGRIRLLSSQRAGAFAPNADLLFGLRARLPGADVWRRQTGNVRAPCRRRDQVRSAPGCAQVSWVSKKVDDGIALVSPFCALSRLHHG